MLTDIFLIVLALFVFLIIVRSIVKIFFASVIINDYEKGLFYKKGKYIRTLDANKYWYYKSNSSIQKIDMRQRILTVKAQEMPSADGVAIKVSLLANYKINNPFNAINAIESYEEGLYTNLQIALRGIIGAIDIDTLIAEKNIFGEKLIGEVAEEVAKFGIDLVSIDIKDIIIPNDLKRIFAQSVKARKEANAALERARGETAALRNLANAAKMVDDNPNLLHLRAIQMLGDSSGNTITLKLEKPDKASVNQD